jgi:DNA modification methylase
MTFDLVHADVLEWLTSYDGPKYQAILSDPPYALISITKRFGKKDSAPAQEGRDGRFRRLSGGFLGQKWDGFDSLEHYQDWIAEWSKLPKKKRAKGNIHPTVKPLDLMRYLSTMILPPPPKSGLDRRLLVPFAGSGSEGIGAIQAGWEIVTGIEMEKNYIEIAEARYTGNLGLFSLK